MNPIGSIAALLDLSPKKDRFLEDFLTGLQGSQKRLSSKYFYDKEGSRLFDLICTQDEYYLTRVELDIMKTQASSMSRHLGPGCLLVELGSGSSLKTRYLLDHLETPAGYVPLDISKEHLQETTRNLQEAYPWLEILPVCTDFVDRFEIPVARIAEEYRLIYFPGSTLGNFHPPDAVQLLSRWGNLCDPGGHILIGVDLKKDPAVIDRAYNDRAGITALFNKNLLVRANRELHTDFELGHFDHRAFYNEELGRIEMHLVSTRKQVVSIDDTLIEFEEGETILTECSYKYNLAEFQSMALESGLLIERVWTDPQKWFAVLCMTPQKT